MPLLVFVLLVVLIVQIGFWDSLLAVLGAAILIGIFTFVCLAILAVTALLAVRSVKRRGWQKR